MKKISSCSLLVLLLLVSCNSDSSFTINTTQIGPITKTTTVSELETLFAKDSLVDYDSAKQIKDRVTGITVYEKGGKKLMRILPEEGNPQSTIKNVKLFDERYKTDKGIGLASTFKDLNAAYTIKRIDNLLDVIVLFVAGSDAYFTIDKKHLASELMFNTRDKIEVTQIPDNTPLKYFMVEW